MYDIIIVGAGPAGISMAVEAVAAGISADRILVLEKSHEHSFTIRKYYPDKKLVTANYKGFEAVCIGTMCIPDLSKNETISYLDKAIADNDVTVHYSETVWKIDEHFDEQKFTVYTDKASYKTRTVAIAVGILGKPNKPEYKLPISLNERIRFDITSVEIKNSKVLVVGGGDSASEYCQFLVQSGNQVTLSYRQREFKRMNNINRESLITLADEGKVNLILGSNVIEVTESDGKPKVKFLEKELDFITFDYIVYALGGTTPHNFLKAIGIEFNGNEPVLKEDYETSVPGMFLLGDLSAGNKGGSIIWAFNSASRAIKRILDNYLPQAID